MLKSPPSLIAGQPTLFLESDELSLDAPVAYGDALPGFVNGCLCPGLGKPSWIPSFLLVNRAFEQ